MCVSSGIRSADALANHPPRFVKVCQWALYQRDMSEKSRGIKIRPFWQVAAIKHGYKSVAPFSVLFKINSSCAFPVSSRLCITPWRMPLSPSTLLTRLPFYLFNWFSCRLCFFAMLKHFFWTIPFTLAAPDNNNWVRRDKVVKFWRDVGYCCRPAPAGDERGGLISGCEALLFVSRLWWHCYKMPDLYC